MDIGFTYYNEVVSTAPTTQEILDSITDQQKIGVLNGFALKTPVIELKHLTGVDSVSIKHLYRKIDEIEETCRTLVRGELLITPAVIDIETGEETTPAVYNTPPATINALKDDIAALFVVDFDATQVGAIIDKMIAYSKDDGSGDAAYYAAEVVK